MPNVLFFDAAFTLIHPHPGVGTLYAGEARRHGVVVEAAALDAAFGAVWTEARAQVPAGRPPYGQTEADARAFWHDVVERVFRRAGSTMPGGEFFREVFDLFGRREAWHLDADAMASIARARAVGWKVAVLSNFDTRLHGILRDLDVTRHLDALIVSCDVGFEKPDPGIYSAAMARLGVQPGDMVAMVGDSPAEDHDAPRALGWRAALVDPRGRYSARPNTRRAATLGEAVELVLA